VPRGGENKLPHYGGKSANPFWLYTYARTRSIVVSQRMPTFGSTDALTPLERNGIPILGTWKRGAVQFERRSDRIITEGFPDQRDQGRSQPPS
jgi:competence protein ComEC